ncbi:MAG: tail fiber domain-containing protein [Akkermansiaceae bacterium]|nr:tail fiber domain-containing protein [Akkermansiaceae bacterium]
MKSHHRLLLALAPLLALPVTAQTQTTVVPKFISYQGTVANADGTAVGGNNAPVNRSVVFRVWNHATNSNPENLLYSETQVVTIADGQFSVLVGEGVATTVGNYGAETSKKLTDISAAFAGENCYLGVTVAAGVALGSTDSEISPRQRVVSTAFALRAKYAEQLGSTGSTALTALDSGKVGVGNSAPPALFTVSGANTSTSTPQLLVTADDVTERLLIGVDSTGTGTGFIQAYKESVGAQNLLLNSNGGNVGIGTTSPGFPLNFAEVLGDKISLWGSLGNSYGFGVQASLLQIHTDTSAADIAFGYGSSAAMTETMRIKGNGNVCIGTTTPYPATKLTVNGSITAYSANSPVVTVRDSSFTKSLEMGIATNAGGYSSSAAIGDSVIRAMVSSKLHLQTGGGAAGITLDTSNNVGIGTSNPGAKLHVNEATGTLAGANSGSLILQHGNMGGASSITFPSASNNGSDYGYIQFQDASTVGGAGETNRLIIGTQNDADDHICLMPSGFVGIRTTSPQAPLHVGGYANNSFNLDYYYFSGGGIDQNANNYTGSPHSIVAESGIQTIRIDINSDARIKHVLQLSNTSADLETLKSLKITDYNYKDKALGTTPQKKVIAQDVEAVFPQAVSQSTAVVPDIFQKATEDGGWVKLATDLKVGERVRLISRKGEEIHEVLEVRPDAFRTSHRGANEPVFVYGREVKDFRSVDYDALAMLNVSATQELAKQVKEKDAKIQALQDESVSQRREIDTLRSELAATGQSMETRLIALEKRLSKGSTPETVSVELSNTAK